VKQGRDFVQEKTNRVSAAVQAGKDAYATAAGQEAPMAGPQPVAETEGQS